MYPMDVGGIESDRQMTLKMDTGTRLLRDRLTFEVDVVAFEEM